MKKIISLIFLILPSLTQAFEIQINPGEYKGTYGVMGETSTLTGTQSVELDQGVYHIIVGAISSFQFTVLEDGSVEINSPLSATSVENQITMTTQEVNIDVAGYEGKWSLPAVRPSQKGSVEAITLVSGLRYLIQVAAVDSMAIELKESGIVALNKPVATTILNDTITFNTASVAVNPGDYKGPWLLSEILDSMTGVKENISLVLGLKYLVQLGAVGSFYINMTASGDLVSQKLESASVENNVLNFNTYFVDIDANDYSDSWLIATVTEAFNGVRSGVALIPGVSFRLDLENGASKTFAISSHCLEELSSIMVGENNFSYKCSKEKEVPFSCEKKVYEVKKVRCRGSFVAKNMDQLNEYIENEGMFGGKYKSLKLFFSPSEDIEVHSPCHIQVKARHSINVNNICLDGRKGVSVKAHKKAKISANNIFLLSSKGKVRLKKNLNIESDNLVIDAKK